VVVWVDLRTRQRYVGRGALTKKKAKAAATFFIHTATFVPALKISNLARARARRNK
tara:strand:+ start:2473 stop:2640 length:168 start_codon:yes stop_codon:yes gene_type:complete